MTHSINLRDEATTAENWMRGQLLPLWIERGIDRKRGGFYDKLDLFNAENSADYKRLRVTARQIYVFSQAVLWGWEEGREALEHGLEFLFSRARGSDGGYAIRFDLEGETTDGRRDLYDTAFVLFALSYAYRATGERELRTRALEALGFLMEKFRHPHLGFHEQLPVLPGPRRQNPHMHLLEAMLAWATATDDPEPFRNEAARLVGLFRRKFWSAEPGAVREFLDDDLNPLTDDAGRIIEPGHSYEWIWLLNEWSKLSGESVVEIPQLYATAQEVGLSPELGAVIEEVWIDTGRPRSASCRLWAQTERLKATLALVENGGSGRALSDALAAAAALRNFWEASPTAGLARERRNADGTWSDEPAPASSVYHIVLSYSELSRVARASGRYELSTNAA